MGALNRGERLQIMLTDDELKAVDDWRFSTRMPSRAAAVRELLKRGLATEGFDLANRATKSKDFSVVSEKSMSKAGGRADKSNGREGAGK